jgi:hypothetical protein
MKFLKSFTLALAFLPLLRPSSLVAQKADSHLGEMTLSASLISPVSEKFSNRHFAGTIAFTVRLADWAGCGVYGSLASPTGTYDGIGGTETITTTASSFGITAQVRFIEFGALSLRGAGSFGVMILDTPERKVSIGARGFVTVPARTDRFGVLTIGPGAALRLSDAVGVFLSPQLHFVSPYQLSSSGFAVEGGLTVGIL